MRTKKVINSKTLWFFLLSLIALLTQGLLSDQTPTDFSWFLVDWKAISLAAGGLILRFFTGKGIDTGLNK